LYQREISRPLLNYKFDDQNNNGTVKTTATVNTVSWILVLEYEEFSFVFLLGTSKERRNRLGVC
jgi:hypothetical protein